MSALVISHTSWILGHVGSENRSLSQINGKFVNTRDQVLMKLDNADDGVVYSWHRPKPYGRAMKLAQNVCFNDTSTKFIRGSCRICTKLVQNMSLSHMIEAITHIIIYLIHHILMPEMFLPFNTFILCLELNMLVHCTILWHVLFTCVSLFCNMLDGF